MERCDVLVVGAGIAGCSVAAELAAHARVLVIEREDQPGTHSTGRSAGLFTTTYGPPPIRSLAAASHAFLDGPPPGFADHPLLRRRGLLLVARADQVAALAAEEAAAGRASGADFPLRRLEPAAALDLVPVLRREALAGALFEPDAMDMEVHALQQGYLRLLRARGGRLLTGAGLQDLDRTAEGWRVQTAAGPIAAATLVDAAGAWADEVAAMGGAAPLGLVAKRRTVLTFDPAEPVTSAGWPFVVDIDEQFYFKPEGGRILASPADATPVAPGDVQPEEIDVAIAIDRVERATTLRVRRVTHRWAGLRTFAADGLPVVGWDGAVPGLFWLAGQGGYGIKTAPALARMAAALVLGRSIPADLAQRGIDAAALSPRRFA